MKTSELVWLSACIILVVNFVIALIIFLTFDIGMNYMGFSGIVLALVGFPRLIKPNSRDYY